MTRCASYTVLLLSLLVGWPLPAKGDQWLEILETKETETFLTGEKWFSNEKVLFKLGDGVARLDRGDFSCIVDTAEGKMSWIDHQDQTVADLDLPVHLEVLVQDPRLKSALKVFHQQEPELLGQSKEFVEGLESELYRWSLEIQNTVTFSAWMVDMARVDEELFALLQENCSFLEPHLPTLLRRLHAHPGIPYRLRTERESSSFSVRETLEIMDRIEFQASWDTYRPPETYSTVPFDASRYISFVGGPGP